MIIFADSSPLYFVLLREETELVFSGGAT